MATGEIRHQEHRTPAQTRDERDGAVEEGGTADQCSALGGRAPGYAIIPPMLWWYATQNWGSRPVHVQRSIYNW